MLIDIFTETTTRLSHEFVDKIPAVALDSALEEMCERLRVHMRKKDHSYTLVGKWNKLVVAYDSLKQCFLQDGKFGDERCIFENSIGELERRNTKASTGITSYESDTSCRKSLDIDLNYVAVKQESKSNDEASFLDNVQATAEDEAGNHLSEIRTAASNNDPLQLERKTDRMEMRKRVSRMNFKEECEDLQSTETCKKVTDELKCPKCDYVGNSKKRVQHHLMRKHLPGFQCTTCDKKFGYKSDLQRHVREVHVILKGSFCTICNKYLKTKGYFEEHKAMHREDYVYQCKLCQKSASTKVIIAKHFRFRHPGVKIKFCELHVSKQKTESQLKLDENLPDNHPNVDGSKLQNEVGMNDSKLVVDVHEMLDDDEKIVHETDNIKITLKKLRNKGRPWLNKRSGQCGKSEFSCKFCNYIGMKKCQLMYHIRRNHVLKFFCEVCQKPFGYQSDLKRHKQQVHKEPSYVCHICSKSYKVKKSFETHLRSHEQGYVKAVYPCNLCIKSFSAKQVLDNHVKFVHMGIQRKERPSFLCQTCGMEFRYKHTYKSHMNKHSGILPFKCEVCEKAFASKDAVKDHQLTHDNKRNFSCHICPKSFKTSSALNSHVAIHENNKSYKCLFCGKDFLRKESLQRHERIHSGNKPYTCTLCDRSFTDSATIRNHMILVHKKDKHHWQGDVISSLKKQHKFLGAQSPAGTSLDCNVLMPSNTNEHLN